MEIKKIGLVLLIIFFVIPVFPINAETITEPLISENPFADYGPKPLDLDKVATSIVTIALKVVNLGLYVFYAIAIIATIVGLILFIIAAIGGGLDARKKAFACFIAVFFALFFAQILIPAIYVNFSNL